MKFEKGEKIFWYHNDEIKRFYMAVAHNGYSKMLCVVKKRPEKNKRIDCELKSFIRKDRGKFFPTFDECWNFAMCDIGLRMSKLKGLEHRFGNLVEADLDES